ncbi:hypothetical protein NHH03_26835 [Stieleria sp. TO1_6]|uniref:DUF6959 family protein n=1 Tax=Stieleria tagensis TaxID=2956795 RepID=UPI00209B723F|nr:hypothetical protein [Stieleria tagensis]MCO8125384.1 hypothetical protein [Stieleria tagensis]
MRVEPLEVFAEDSNFAVIKPPGRNYPGSVIQGDTLANLCRNAIQIADQMKLAGVPRDSQHAIQELANSLINRLLHYQAVLDAHGVEYPHVRPLSEEDRVNFDRDHRNE